MIDEKILLEFKRAEKAYQQKFGDGYIALVDPVHPRKQDYLDGIKIMKAAIKDNKPLPSMNDKVVY